MRTLCVADEFAWPTVSGYRIRLDHVLRALATLGPVDYLAVLNDDRPADLAAAPDVTGINRVRVVRSSAPRRRLTQVLRAVGGRLPRRILWPDWTEAREVVTDWTSAGYDLVWCGHAETYVALGELFAAPAVVDLDNLEGRLLQERRANHPADPTRTPWRRRVADMFDRLDEWRWTSLERRIARTVASVVVCSEVDRARLGVAAGAVVPNAYEPGEVPSSSDVPKGPLTVVFVGLFVYEPNRDAARRLVREILPRLRRAEPVAQVRLVGRDAGLLDDLRDVPGVTVVGEVADVGPELARADIVAVTLRFGSGTRVKLLEAFAHGRPVVSTRLGAEGLDVSDGEHLLLADDAEAFAGACLRLHREPALAERLAESGRELWERKYRWGSVRDSVVAVVGQVLGSPAGNMPQPEAQA